MLFAFLPSGCFHKLISTNLDPLTLGHFFPEGTTQSLVAAQPFTSSSRLVLYSYCCSSHAASLLTKYHCTLPCIVREGCKSPGGQRHSAILQLPLCRLSAEAQLFCRFTHARPCQLSPSCTASGLQRTRRKKKVPAVQSAASIDWGHYQDQPALLRSFLPSANLQLPTSFVGISAPVHLTAVR
jgi:hypothetical protein